MFNKRCICWW